MRAKAACVGRFLTSVLVLQLFLIQASGWAAGEGDLRPPVVEDPLDRGIVSARGDVAANPGKAASHLRLGNLLLKKGALSEALASFDTALKLNPRSHEAKTGKGIILVRTGALDDGERILREALLLNPDPVRAYYELGLLDEKREQFGRAVAEYKDGLKKHRQGRK